MLPRISDDRSWFDIPIIYTNGSRAILTMEKGMPGERAFTDAFATWARDADFSAETVQC